MTQFNTPIPSSQLTVQARDSVELDDDGIAELADYQGSSDSRSRSSPATAAAPGLGAAALDPIAMGMPMHWHSTWLKTIWPLAEFLLMLTALVIYIEIAPVDMAAKCPPRLQRACLDVYVGAGGSYDSALTDPSCGDARIHCWRSGLKEILYNGLTLPEATTSVPLTADRLGVSGRVLAEYKYGNLNFPALVWTNACWLQFLSSSLCVTLHTACDALAPGPRAHWMLISWGVRPDGVRRNCKFPKLGLQARAGVLPVPAHHERYRATPDLGRRLAVRDRVLLRRARVDEPGGRDLGTGASLPRCLGPGDRRVRYRLRRRRPQHDRARDDCEHRAALAGVVGVCGGGDRALLHLVQ